MFWRFYNPWNKRKKKGGNISFLISFLFTWVVRKPLQNAINHDPKSILRRMLIYKKGFVERAKISLLKKEARPIILLIDLDDRIYEDTFVTAHPNIKAQNLSDNLTQE
jgi:hypothetical protein